MSRSVLENAMRDLEEIFVLNSRNTISEVGGVAGQVGGSALRSRQISNQLTANADDAVFLNRYLTEVLPPNIKSSGSPGDPANPAEPRGSIIAYHVAQGTNANTGRLVLDGSNKVVGGYVAEITIKDLLGDVPGGSANINTQVGSPQTDKPSLGIVEINNPFLSLPTRNVLPVSLFCTSMPTLEISRAVPFVIVRVISPMSPTKGGRTTTLSLGSYLGDSSSEIKPGTVEHDIATSARSTRLPAGVLVPSGSQPGEQSLFGMEMFTTPQTLVNANKLVGSRGVPILDPFRPLMSLESVNIRVTPAGHGALAFKEGTVNIKIHDRSKMQDVGQLLRPDQFGYNFIELEYGWAHPDDAGANNPYAPFINSFRQRELYTVVSSNVSMGDDGAVSVSIRCALKGARDLLNLTPISEVWTSTTQAEQLFEEANRIIRNIDADKDEKPETDIRYVETIRSLSRGGASGKFGISAEEKSLIKEFIKSASSNTGDLGELRTKIVEIYGADGEGGEYKKIIDNATTVFKKKMDAVTTSAELYELGKRNTGTAQIDTTIDAKQKTTRGYITFGKAVAAFVGAPLTSGNFAEVQLLFYTFNSDAGAVNRRNIAEFPIEIAKFNTAFEDAIRTDPKMPLKKVMRILANLVSDSSAAAYGIKPDPVLQPGATEKDEDRKARVSSNSTLMTQYGCMTTRFKKPVIEYTLDSIRIGDQPVLRIHFFDKKSTPNDEALYLLDLQFAGGGSEELVNLVGTLQQGDATKLNSGVLQGAVDEGIVRATTATKDGKTRTSYAMNTNSVVLKRYIKRTVPSITYGSPGSVLTSFSLQSIDMQDFETALLVQAANGTRVPGQPDTNSPQNDMQIYPMNIGVSILGCPLIDYAQEFFFDMDTGTSIDNVYVVNGITHSISPGSFKTDLDLKLTRTTGANSALDSKIRTLIKSIDDKAKG